MRCVFPGQVRFLPLRSRHLESYSTVLTRNSGFAGPSLLARIKGLLGRAITPQLLAGQGTARWSPQAQDGADEPDDRRQLNSRRGPYDRKADPCQGEDGATKDRSERANHDLARRSAEPLAPKLSALPIRSLVL